MSFWGHLGEQKAARKNGIAWAFVWALFFSKNNSFFLGLSKDGSLGCKLKQALFSQPCDGQFKSKTLQKAQKKGHFSLDLSKNR